ncbi:(2Fe-2S)-binding protein [Bifidobacterium aemilianum]|uniref:succinate dehydrogenase n=1 Tax=Bifidobacterium aemilianum TaxID=2493120 RepID=A0A366KAH1_9BIFI|nr:2Fe-2S iron-sulfur cluster-binding protein [Bifidobacterium aemilianum]RBP98138.1 (2Fe-2S)-binding protein [Bifidobacterium aemilianum]
MSGDVAKARVTLRISRFTPRAEQAAKRPSSPFAAKSSSPFAKSTSPFGASSAPRRARGKRWTQDYSLVVRPQDSILDCLLTIKRTMDPTLAFRYSCGHGMCGSDAAAVNGTPTLLCKTSVGQSAQGAAVAAGSHCGFRHTRPAEGFKQADQQPDQPVKATTDRNDQYHQDNMIQQATDGIVDLGVIELAPLPGFPVQRDLIADIDPMLDQITRLKPYLQTDGKLATTSEGKVDVFEYLQKPDELAKYELLSNCIACGVCEGSCPVYAGGNPFMGPAALIAASRFINDSRDQAQDARFDAIDTEDGVAACQSVRACSRQCPRGIDVGEEMWQLISRVGQRQEQDLA